MYRLITVNFNSISETVHGIACSAALYSLSECVEHVCSHADVPYRGTASIGTQIQQLSCKERNILASPVAI